MCDTLDLLDRLLTIAKRPQQGTTKYADLACELSRRGYGAIALQQTFRCLDEGWSVKECWWIRESDRASVEALLPPQTECWDGCAQCAEDAAIRQELLKPTTNTR